MTSSSIVPSSGDVVVLPFIFLDGTGSKSRPAVALTSQVFNRTRGYFVFTPLTGSPGHDDRAEVNNLAVAGLNIRSYSHGMLFSAVNDDITRIAGHLAAPDIARIRSLIKQVLLL